MPYEEMSQQPQQDAEAKAQVSPGFLSKPQRQARQRPGRLLSFLLPLIGGLTLLIAGSVLLWQISLHQAPSKPGNGQNVPPQKSCGSRLPWDWINQQFAQQLHLSVDQIKTKVHAGKTVQDIAAAQGISAQHLYTIESHVIQQANTRWLQQSCINQQVYNDNAQRFQRETPAQMNDSFTNFYK